MAALERGAYNAPILSRSVQIGCRLLPLVIAGCGGGEEARLSLRFLYPSNPNGATSPPHEWEGYGCADDAQESGACVAVRLSVPTEPSGNWQPVLDGPGVGQDDTIIDVQGGTFDLSTRTANRNDLRLEVGLYDRDGNLMATGESRGVSFVEDHPTSVTMLAVGKRTSCPQPSSAAVDQLSKRAFHTATLLPNGEVLLVGGVAGPVVLTPASGIEESMEALDPRSGVARRLLVENRTAEEQGSQIYRAFHHSAFLRADPDGRYRVRVFGGIRAFGSQTVAIVSRDRADTPLQLLVSHSADAEVAPPVDLLYDVATRTVEVVDVTDDRDSYPKASFGGFAVLADELGADVIPLGTRAGFYLGGGLGPWTARQYAIGQVDPVLGTFEANQNGGTINPTPPSLRVGRVGSTAIPIGSESVLFWGGNAWSAEGAPTPEDADATIAAEIGELHHPSGGVPEFVEPTGLAVRSTAFHAAAVAAVDDDRTRRIVVAGGYVLSGLGTVDTTLFSPEPLYLLSFDPDTSTARTSAVECQDRNDRPADCSAVFGDVAYATATWVADGQVLVVGGNFRYSPDGRRYTLFGARAVAGIVTVTGDSAVFEPVDLSAARYGHTATRLEDGAILIAGGITLECDRINPDGSCEQFGDLVPLATYEIFNPGLAFSPTGSCEPPAS